MDRARRHTPPPASVTERGEMSDLDGYASPRGERSRRREIAERATRRSATLTLATTIFPGPVSYTHLDVYKRQARHRAVVSTRRRAWGSRGPAGQGLPTLRSRRLGPLSHRREHWFGLVDRGRCCQCPRRVGAVDEHAGRHRLLRGAACARRRLLDPALGRSGHPLIDPPIRADASGATPPPARGVAPVASSSRTSPCSHTGSP